MGLMQSCLLFTNAAQLQSCLMFTRGSLFLMNTKRNTNASYGDFESRFNAQLAPFNSLATDASLSDSISDFMLFANAAAGPASVCRYSLLPLLYLTLSIPSPLQMTCSNSYSTNLLPLYCVSVTISTSTILLFVPLAPVSLTSQIFLISL